MPIVALPDGGALIDQLRARGISIEILPQPALLSRYGGAIYRYSRRQKLGSGLQALSYIRRIRRRLAQLEPDAVFCNDMRGLLTFGMAARTLGVPVMIWDKLDRPHGWLDHLQLPLAQINAIISNAVAGKYPRWQRHWFRNRIVLVPNGVDSSLFERAPAIRPKLGLASDDVVFAVIGAVTWRKGQDRVLAVFEDLAREVPRARLVIVGGPTTPDDEQYLARLPLRADRRVLWLGLRRDVPEIMRSIDVLVVPSRQEGMGQVVLEGMAAGRPVVAARAGGLPEVVRNGDTGLLFDGDDPQQLLVSLVRLGRSPDLREQFGRAGQLMVRSRYNRQAQIHTALRLITSAVTRKNPRS